MKTIHSIIPSLEEIHGPVYVFRPKALEKSSLYFLKNFKGTCLYAVKSNSDPEVLQALNQYGIDHFEVASINEIEMCHNMFPSSTLFFMHPVKSRQAIRQAYFQYGVRHFCLDSEDELKKIQEETQGAKDLSLHVRLEIPNQFAAMSLSGKFGKDLISIPKLIRKVDNYAKKIGITFHVGSQCMHPRAFEISIQSAREIIAKTGVSLSYFNVGGGFPSMYPGMIPPSLDLYFSAIHHSFSKLDNHENIQLLAEPGRALVAECMSLIVRVELRKDKKLYINEGTYGGLFDAGTPRFIFPSKLISNKTFGFSDLLPFSLYGPTCDSLDYMPGPFHLPFSIQEGDYIEIGQMGAYARSLTTSFNGFSPAKEMINVIDPPLMSMYE
ncbi:MAG TPA: type III PLP-dependent enzyme [Gammaproteobacteria bacterium]|nr:type III PLP-dependent enzyme [Gammaproteobacteria bacterium]